MPPERYFSTTSPNSLRLTKSSQTNSSASPILILMSSTCPNKLAITGLGKAIPAFFSSFSKPDSEMGRYCVCIFSMVRIKLGASTNFGTPFQALPLSAPLVPVVPLKIFREAASGMSRSKASRISSKPSQGIPRRRAKFFSSIYLQTSAGQPCIPAMDLYLHSGYPGTGSESSSVVKRSVISSIKSLIKPGTSDFCKKEASPVRLLCHARTPNLHHTPNICKINL